MSFYMATWLSFYSGLSTALLGLHALPAPLPLALSTGALEVWKAGSVSPLTLFLFFKILWVGGVSEIPYELRDGYFCIEIMIVIALHKCTALRDAVVPTTVSSLQVMNLGSLCKYLSFLIILLLVFYSFHYKTLSFPWLTPENVTLLGAILSEAVPVLDHSSLAHRSTAGLCVDFACCCTADLHNL